MSKEKIRELEIALEAERAFRRHIQSHLSSHQVVICKICGRTAKSIIDTKRRSLKRKQCADGDA